MPDNTNQSSIRDGNDQQQAVPFTQLSDYFNKAATQYETSGRHDRAAGIREAAAVFDQAFKTFQDKNVTNTPSHR